MKQHNIGIGNGYKALKIEMDRVANHAYTAGTLFQHSFAISKELKDGIAIKEIQFITNDVGLAGARINVHFMVQPLMNNSDSNAFSITQPKYYHGFIPVVLDTRGNGRNDFNELTIIRDITIYDRNFYIAFEIANDAIPVGTLGKMWLNIIYK